MRESTFSRYCQGAVKTVCPSNTPHSLCRTQACNRLSFIVVSRMEDRTILPRPHGIPEHKCCRPSKEEGGFAGHAVGDTRNGTNNFS